MTYIICKDRGNGARRFNNKTFATYESARQYVRRWIGKNVGTYNYNLTARIKRNLEHAVVGVPGYHDEFSRNYPSISVLGFSIRKV